MAPARLREQKVRPGGVGFELAAQLTHVNPQVMTAIRMSTAPDGMQQLPVGERLAGVLDQHREESILDGGEVDLTVGHPDLAVQQVYLERTDGELALPGTPGDPRGMAQGDAHAGEELRRPEGFCQVIVRAGIEGLDLLRFLVA